MKRAANVAADGPAGTQNLVRLGSVSAPLPVLLRADNFTPVARTPWGGTRITAHYKRGYLLEGAQQTVGESWEVSVEPDFPALLDGDEGLPLQEYIARAPEAVLGMEHRRGREATALLVKLLDTAEPLSVQIHPNDQYARLTTRECGKPESWYVVEREPGAGLYLGFQPGVDEFAVRTVIAQGGSLEPLMRFIAVEPGDFFVIDAGIPHAIGPGLTLVEPQHVLPGRRGVTFRYWDWNRRYDAQGRASSQGEPRALHVEDALSVTDWARFESNNFVTEVRLRAGEVELDGPAKLRALAGAPGLASAFLAVSRLSGQGACQLPYRDRLQSITVLAGRVTVGTLVIERGRSAVVPACAADFPLTLTGAHAIVCAVT